MAKRVHVPLQNHAHLYALFGRFFIDGKDFFDIMAYAGKLGYSWGMTSNGTLIDEKTAALLKQTGMKTISVSLER